jgi:hypothetical protein
MPENLSFNYLAILVAAVSSFLIGGLWYSPVLFGRVWMRESGFTEKILRAKGRVGQIMAASFALELVMAFNLAAFLGSKATIAFGAFAGAAAGFGWVAMAFGVTYLFERKSLRIFFINAGYHGVALTVMGAILGAWH